eukprot:4639355-Pyramimonas_sp.AAC.1
MRTVSPTLSQANENSSRVHTPRIMLTTSPPLSMVLARLASGRFFPQHHPHASMLPVCSRACRSSRGPNEPTGPREAKTKENTEQSEDGTFRYDEACM